MITPRPHQAKILNYKAGRMGVSAVPGSGKTFTLSLLAAHLINQNVLSDEQEILVVTLVNSSVDNFYSRVGTTIKEMGLLPNIGYRVRTLHGLAHDIVRERPELAGLDNRFQIIDEREADKILDDCVRSWMRSHPDGFDGYMNPDLDEKKVEFAKREKLPGELQSIASNFIRYAKDCQINSEYLRSRLENLSVPLPLADFGGAIYSAYQQALAYRGAVDFDDLIRLALLVLKSEPFYLERLQNRWPYILEDEAQDSSRLQEEILSLLAGSTGNWVRVGDPNQAIYETFTTANPKYLRDFINDSQTQAYSLPTSSRSTQSLINLANNFIKWTMQAHPVVEARDALDAPPFIEPVSLEDENPNPEDDPEGIRMVVRKYSPQEEIQVIAESIARWIPANPERTVAILAPRNHRAFEMIDELQRRKIEVVDSLLRSSTSTRFSAGALTHILRYLADPLSPTKLATVYRVWKRSERSNEEAARKMESLAELIRKCHRTESFLFPGINDDWLASLDPESVDDDGYAHLDAFRSIVRRWLAAVLLPIDQLVLAVAQDLLDQPAELALAHKLALLLRTVSTDHPGWRLPELTEELAIIARNERRFLGLSADDTGFNPDLYPGKVVVTTMHKAKGLEWDRVYLMSVNNYDFPSGATFDKYISERFYFRDNLNLGAEALAQLASLINDTQFTWYQEGEATINARLDYVKERLRLLYVGITRARRGLVITWNSGRRGELLPATALTALHHIVNQGDDASLPAEENGSA
jgi:DNA helicase-2/ATP-dependent DNA helicase PcrA